MPNRSTVYTPQALGQRFPRLKASDQLSGLTVNPNTGDLTTEAVYRTVVGVRGLAWEALGYLDVLDIDQQTLKQEVASLRQDVSSLKQELTAARQELGSVRQSLETITAFMGVVIPDWLTREEVENGDDMGIVRPSASELGLIVNFVIDQANPAFDHEQVEAINPPAGTLVARGSTVTVTINLEG